MECIVCRKVFEAKRSTARYCSVACRVAANRSVTEQPDSVTDSVTVSDSVTDFVTAKLKLPEIPGVKRLGVALSPTGSTCSRFEELPTGVQMDIDSLTEWCAMKRIPFDRDAQVSRAIHYQRYVRAG